MSKNNISSGLIWCLIFGLLLPSMVMSQTSKNNDSDRPNIIFILTDDQRWDALGCAGNKVIKTPEMDKLAEKGTYFRYVNNKSLEELYHLASDPQETNNLAENEEYRKQLTVLRQKTDQLAQKYSDPYSGVPAGLTIENIRDPGDHVEIVDEKPEFGWIVPDEANLQKAYQILVASEKEWIDYNIGDIWDSGVIRSNKSVDVEFEGAPLNPHTKYFWKVRIYDQDNRLSGYSKVQSFKTGSFQEKHLTSENDFQTEKLRPTGFRQDADSAFFIDFGKAAFGTLLLNYSPKENDTLTIRLGEKLLNGNIDRNPGGSIRFQEVKQEVKPGKTRYRISLQADPRNTNEKAVALPDSFPVIMPFRYAEIEDVDNLNRNDVMQLAYFGYFDDSVSAFTSSDTILNQVWDLCKYSIKSTTFAGVYVDGDRERIPYEADAYLNQMSHYSVDREYAMARKTIEYFMEHPTWPTEWQLHVALMFYQDYMHTGNSELVERYYEALKHKTLMALEVEDGLISTHSKNHNGVLMDKLGFRDTTMRLRDIVDWPPAQSDTGWELATEEGERDGFVFTEINTVVNSFYYKNMKIMATFARLLNKTDDALEFEYKASRVRKSINEKLFNDEAGHYVDGIGTDHGSVHANMMPLAFGIVPESRQKSVVGHIKTRGMACSVYGAWFLMEALYNAGASDYALDLLTATHDRSWWNMIAIGSTITLEAWDMKYKPNADWNHAWGAVPANTIPRGLWGIKPLEPGFKEVVIKPQMSDLKSSAVTTPTIRGQITCKYQQVSPRHQQYDIELPANMVGYFKTNRDIQNEITVNGETHNPMHGSIPLKPGLNRIDIR